MDRWSEHDRQLRDPAQVAAHWDEAGRVDPRLLRYRVHGEWWETVARLQVTLIVTREYEHVAVALGLLHGEPLETYFRLPHPSGVAVDERRGVVHVAATRNPNQVFDFVPAEVPSTADDGFLPLVASRTRFLPGALYLHDLAFVGGTLHANAVGQNAIVALRGARGYDRVWWPRSIERDGVPDFGRNYLQLNSIAAGPSLARSFFSASVASPGARRPGQRSFRVDRRGVLFSGRTREPIATGLTRPHSARLHRGDLWVDDSGYGRVGRIEGGEFVEVARLPGWSRGLALCGDVAFVGTSRVIPRFRHYAPGLDVDRSTCGVHAVDLRTGRVLGAIVWPAGNQIFAVEPVAAATTAGFPFLAGRRRSLRRDRAVFYAFEPAVGPTKESQ